MALEVRKSERENSQSLLRRFTKKVQRSGVLVLARKSRFHKRVKSEEMQKRAALRKELLKGQYEQLKKLGKEPKNKHGRRR